MQHYVTIFDSTYLPQGLALHESLERHAGSFVLWVLCVDADAAAVLRRLQLPHLRVLDLSSVETPELLAVKAGRTTVEYCWTLTPFAPRFVFEADPSVDQVTYLDADLCFVRDPAPLHRELADSRKHVLITEHAYSAEHDQTETSGRFCVQFITFTRAGEPVRAWWQARCLEWCFARLENGKFGDQMYLDDWPERFPDFVHVLQNRAATLAPWNATRFPCEHAVFYHFHGLRLLDAASVDLGHYVLPHKVVRRLYHPYFRALARAVTRLRTIGFQPRPQQPRPEPNLGLRTALHRLRLHGWRYSLRKFRHIGNTKMVRD